ncbi:MAG: hypothetical protein ACERKN_18000 [Velocimicrobium sp.]
MKKYGKKLVAMLSLSLLVTSIPFTAKAAATPTYKVERTSLYENSKAKGVYKYTVKNLKKGEKIKWVLTGAGKKYASLKYKNSTVKGKTASNKITIDTKDEDAARNAILALTAKVYTSKGKLVAKVKDRVKLKVQATDIVISTAKITDDVTALTVGKTYDFDTTISPSNTTSKVYWSVTSVTGEDHSSEITTDGKWTPTANGKYTVKAMARNSKSGKTIVYHTASVSVGLALMSVKQIAANQFYAVFSDNARDIVNAENFNIVASNGSASITAKNVTFSATGKTVYVTTNSTFSDKTSYTVTYGNNARAFIASVGPVEKAVILTESVEVGKETPIKYALYDENNIDVKAAAKGVVNFSADVINGYKTEEDSLFMYTVGKTANVTLIYTEDNSTTEIKAVKVIKCVEETTTEVASKDFTLTATKTAPDFSAKDYQAVTSTAIGETAYAHFRALDENKNEIAYRFVSYISSDDDTLIIDSDGKLTPIKTGTVKVTVCAVEGEKEIKYTFSVTILGKKVPSTISLNKTYVSMSNTNVYGYEEYIDVTLKDQYGTMLPLTDATCTIRENSGKKVIATYNKANKQIILTARTIAADTYNYTATFVVNGVTLTTTFSVVVQTVPTMGNIGYQIEANNQNFDMLVDSSISIDKTITIHLNKYVAGVFAGYASITSATVKKDGYYYTNDLTASGNKTEQINTVTNGNSIVLTPVKLTTTNSNVQECVKAATGIYTVTIKYFDSTGATSTESINITLLDSQEASDITTKSTTSTKTVQTALALVNNCVSLSDDSVIYDCTATGYSNTGDSVLIVAGQKIHIDTISIKQIVNISTSQKIYIYYTVTLDKTLTNKS